jgi:hypothetical protein
MRSQKNALGKTVSVPDFLQIHGPKNAGKKGQLAGDSRLLVVGLNTQLSARVYSLGTLARPRFARVSAIIW